MHFQRNILLSLLSLKLTMGEYIPIGNSEVNYAPGSAVTDHSAIDLDQRSLERSLFVGDYTAGEAVYTQGGNSKSYAEVTLTRVLSTDYFKGTRVLGTSVDGTTVTGKLYADASVGETVVKVQYDTSNGVDFMRCRVGGMPADHQTTSGCLMSSGTITLVKVLTITVTSESYGYNYDVATGNKNGRTIKGFSTGAEAKMYTCPNCPYSEYDKYVQYFGAFDYADQWIMAALRGTATEFDTSAPIKNTDYTGTSIARVEGAKKGTAYMAVYMYILREFEDAYDDCMIGCTSCNLDSVHAWDEGVAFYTGSQQNDEDGYLMFSFANKRCRNFNTCGEFGGEFEGTAKINHDLFKMFATARDYLADGQCEPIRSIIEDVTALMAVPFIQGTLRYAHKVGREGDGEKGKMEGAVFAAGVLPRIHACSPDDAEIIATSMHFNSPTAPDYVAVKTAFENTYQCLGITCETVGGYGPNDGTYFPDAQPCNATNLD